MDFRHKFLAHFSRQRRHTRDPADCLNIWRKDHESVEDFITRYNKECLEFGDVGENMMHAHFMRAVKCDDLIKRVKGRNGGPKDWDTFIEAAKTIARTDKQLTSDDSHQYNYSQHDRRNKKGKGQPWKPSGYRERSPPTEDARATINQISHRKEVKKENREKQWTPLTKTPSEVLSTENHQFKPLLQMRNKRGQDPNLFCEFHKDIGHLTDDCISLRQEIERALKGGKLTHLVKGKRDNRQIQRMEEGPDNKKLRKLETHMIQVGPRRPRKNYNKRAQDDSWRERQVVFPVVRGGPRERRPIVIPGVFGHYQTYYIFIDPGSTADIIYEQCFNQLDQEDKARLEPVDYPFTGFCNEAVFPLGQISFPVLLSDGKNSRTEEVTFMVLPANSRHDILLGRESQGDFSMICSGPRSAVGFPTETGIAIIYASKEVLASDESDQQKQASTHRVQNPKNGY
ncbi:uncharacterized protein LOC110901385 [Helianthus annuus]|uniref:uncharacterized protein LOC110901385 n=1 Tax=Helianthus annuus TaxID=4232 RepID=UPI000B8EF98F|nr:uncharacterized protein LOC110901385 [Helianthus annuus]